MLSVKIKTCFVHGRFRAYGTQRDLSVSARRIMAREPRETVSAGRSSLPGRFFHFLLPLLSLPSNKTPFNRYSQHLPAVANRKPLRRGVGQPTRDSHRAPPPPLSALHSSGPARLIKSSSLDHASRDPWHPKAFRAWNSRCDARLLLRGVRFTEN